MLRIFLKISPVTPSAPRSGRPFSFILKAVSYTHLVELMALCTPILAYAGIAIGKDLDEFKKQGVKIIIVSILTFIGTFVGSAVIAEVVLKATGGI